MIERNCKNCFHRSVCLVSGGTSKAKNCLDFYDERAIIKLPVPIGAPVFEVQTEVDGKRHIVEKKFEYSMIDKYEKTIFYSKRHAKYIFGKMNELENAEENI